MEKEGKSSKGSSKATDTDLLLQWGNRKRLRCVKVKKGQNLTNNNSKSSTTTTTTDCLPRKKITSSKAEKEFPSPQQPSRINKNSDLPMNSRRSSSVASPEKEDRYYTTRGSLGFDDNGKVLMDPVKEDKGLVWPRLYITLSNKEKEEDFMAMKGCKPPQRPKKRAKLIQRSLLLVSPGAWLSDLCQERYEVREKKTTKKQRPRGLKAMGSMESDSE